MSESTSDFEYIMKSPEGLLNVRIEATTIREVLLELNTKIEDLNKKMIEFLKSREINDLQNQIDQINTKIDVLEKQGVETAATPQETNDILSENVERKIEESKFLLDQSLRNHMKKSMDELKTSFDQSLTNLKDDTNVENSMKYATIQMFSDLQQNIEDIDNKYQILNVKIKKVPTSEKLSSRNSSPKTSDPNNLTFIQNNLDPSPPNSASQNARISKISIKVSTLESAFDTMKKIIDDMKKKLNDTEKTCNGNAESIRIIEEKIEELQKISKELQMNDQNNNNDLKSNEKPINQYTQPETIIKTVPQKIDMESLKFDVVQSVLDQVIPFINEYIEKVDDLQNNGFTQKVEDENKNDQRSSPSQQVIKKDQKEVASEQDKNNDSSKPSQASNQNRKTRDFTSLVSNRAGSPRATKPSISDPRVGACEMQIKALKNSMTALENAMKSQFGLFDSRLTELLLRTASIEKCLEDQGAKIEKVQIVQEVPNQNQQQNQDVGDVGCQTVDDDVGVMVDLNEIEKNDSTKQKDAENEKQKSSSIQQETSSTPANDQQQTISSPKRTQKDSTEVLGNQNKTENEIVTEKVKDNENEAAKTPPSSNKTIVKPVISQRPSTANSVSHTTSNAAPSIPSIRKEDLQLMFGTPVNTSSRGGGGLSSRSNLSARSHITSQTYEELDSLTKRLEQKVSELARQVQNTTDRLGDEDRQIHQLRKSLDSQVTRDDLEELRAEFEERQSFNRKNNPNAESVTALQLKRVVQNFQNSIKTIDKQLESVTEKVPNFVSRQELTELVDVVSQLTNQQTKEKSIATAGGSMAYKCLLCGRPTNQVTGMITESEVARMIGEPPIIGATAAAVPRGSADNNDGGIYAGSGGELVLMYGKEGLTAHRATSQMSSKRKKMPILPKIQPKTPSLQVTNGNNGSVNANNS